MEQTEIRLPQDVEEIVRLLGFTNKEETNFLSFLNLDDATFETVSIDILNAIKNVVNEDSFALGLLNENPQLAEISNTEYRLAAEQLKKVITSSEEFSDVKKEFFLNVIDLISQSLMNIKKRLDKSELDLVTVNIECVSDDIQIPKYSHIGDAGMDIRAAEDYVIKPGETILIRTGIKVAIPEGYELQVRPRSGLSLKTKLRISNAPGTLDSGFRGEVCVIAENTDAPIKDIIIQDGKVLSICRGSDIAISKGDRIAQLVLAKYVVANFSQVNDIKVIGNDRKGGFGSTGVQ